MTEKTEYLTSRLRNQSTEIGDRAEAEDLMNEAADHLEALARDRDLTAAENKELLEENMKLEARLAALTTPQEDEWCREESCQHRHWGSGSMPTHRRGADCPEPEPAHEMFPGTTEALDALTIRKDTP